MTQCNKTGPSPTALRRALAALQAGRFQEARAASARWAQHPAGAVIHALARAGDGDVVGGAAAMAAVARAHPQAQHPLIDLLGLLRAHGAGVAATAHIEAALALDPGNPTLLNLLGAARAETGPMEAAVTAFRAAAAAAPGLPAAWSNLGKALAAVGRFAEAESAFATATRLAPHNAQLRLNHGVARLKSGDWSSGWELFRARHALPGRRPPLPGPELRGLDGLEGQRVLLLHDEGFGDTLQFIRWAPLLAARGAEVRVCAPRPLLRLLTGVEGISAVEERPAPYDRWCRIPDLPAVFDAGPDSVPARLPYLRAAPDLVAAAGARLPPGRRVGLVWAGDGRAHDPAAAATDRLRSLDAGQLAPLLATEGVVWISLQLGKAPPRGVVDAMRDVTDFADTAAIVANLDTVVSVDTAVLHLAAGMGRRTILLDRFDHCWRWQPGRAESSWYPETLTIVRQSQPGDWDGVLRRAASLL